MMTFIESIFGSICSHCLYDPKYDGEDYVGIEGIKGFNLEE